MTSKPGPWDETVTHPFIQALKPATELLEAAKACGIDLDKPLVERSKEGRYYVREDWLAFLAHVALDRKDGRIEVDQNWAMAEGVEHYKKIAEWLKELTPARLLEDLGCDHAEAANLVNAPAGTILNMIASRRARQSARKRHVEDDEAKAEAIKIAKDMYKAIKPEDRLYRAGVMAKEIIIPQLEHHFEKKYTIRTVKEWLKENRAIPANAVKQGRPPKRR